MNFLDPQKALKHLKLAKGARIAELHAGSGHFTAHLKDAVGKYGNVHSIQHHQDEDALKLPELVDHVFVINIPIDAHHHVLFSKAYRILKPAGTVILIERSEGTVTPLLVTDLAGMAGFLREKHFHAGTHHFGLVFKKPRV